MTGFSFYQAKRRAVVFLTFPSTKNGVFVVLRFVSRKLIAEFSRLRVLGLDNAARSSPQCARLIVRGANTRARRVFVVSSIDCFAAGKFFCPLSESCSTVWVPQLCLRSETRKIPTMCYSVVLRLPLSQRVSQCTKDVV